MDYQKYTIQKNCKKGKKGTKNIWDKWETNKVVDLNPAISRIALNLSKHSSKRHRFIRLDIKARPNYILFKQKGGKNAFSKLKELRGCRSYMLFQKNLSDNQ